MDKKILIPGWATNTLSFGVTIPYMEWLSQYGTVIVSPPTTEIFDWVDLVVLPGGKDIMSTRYGRVPSFYNSDPDKFKEFFFDENLPKYVELGTPIFGICLGFQQLQVFLGGELNQNCAHPYTSDDDRTKEAHEVVFTHPYKEWAKRLNGGDNKFKVNSMHHQGVELESLAIDLEPILLGPHGIVEAFSHKSKPIMGVQWHPEELEDVVSDFMIRSLIESPRGVDIHKNDLAL